MGKFHVWHLHCWRVLTWGACDDTVTIPIKQEITRNIFFNIISIFSNV